MYLRVSARKDINRPKCYKMLNNLLCRVVRFREKHEKLALFGLRQVAMANGCKQAKATRRRTLRCTVKLRLCHTID